MIEELIGVLRENEQLSELTAEQFTDIFWLAIQQSRFSRLNNQELPINSQNNVTTILLEEKLQPADTHSSTPLSSKSQEVSQPIANYYYHGESIVNLYAKTVSSDSQESKGASTGAGTVPIRVPNAASLPNKLELARSLKSLMRRVPSIYDTILDEVATTEQIANEQLWVPVLKPALEPWLELDLVVDEGASMLIWRDTILELRQLLENLGAFRDIRTWSLFTNQEEVQIRPGIASAVSKQYAHSPRELVDPNGRRLILVLSDCVSSLWRNGVQNGVKDENIISVLNTWANSGSVAIVQMLPQWLWARTALKLASAVQLSGLTPGVANQQLQVRQLSVWDEIDKDQDIKVPIFTLEPEIVATWSKMVAGMGTWTSGIVFSSNSKNLNNEDDTDDGSTELTAKQRFQRFRLTASPMARRLAGLVAAAPIVSLPVIRLIQQTMLPQSRQVHVAEVLLSGLVELKPEIKIQPDTNPDEVEYQFIDGVNEILLDSLSTTDKAIVKFNLLEELTQYITDRIGLSTQSFAGFLRDPRQIGSITEQPNPIAILAVKKLKNLGGKYARFAEELESLDDYYREDTRVVPFVSPAPAYENLPCPYRGLFHFSPNDAEFFFGREVCTGELFAATQTCNFIPVLGASGSGKSSLVLAGLVPKLQNEGHWLFTHFRPGSDPFRALAESLVGLYTQDLNPTEQRYQAGQLAKYLQNRDVLLADVFAQIHQNHPTDRVLLIADQFEEIYTLCTDQKIRRSFLDTLLASFPSFPSQSQHKRVLVAIMRADFLGNALLYPPFGDLLKTDIKLIRTMNYEELEQVIVKPAEKLGVTFQEGLVKRILNDVESEPGNLPLLEFALTVLWERRKGKQLTHTAYEDIGEVKGVLARHADEIYGKLTDDEKEKVRRIFIQLVRPGEGTEDTRRLATKAELPEASWGLLKQLADARLVVTSCNPEDQETVEVVHEALIRNWGQLRQWMDADRSFRAWQERLRIAIHQWNYTQRDKGALLRGVLLVEAEEKLKQRREDLCEEEQEFIQASVALRDRENRPWWKRILD